MVFRYLVPFPRNSLLEMFYFVFFEILTEPSLSDNFLLGSSGVLRYSVPSLPEKLLECNPCMRGFIKFPILDYLSSLDFAWVVLFAISLSWDLPLSSHFYSPRFPATPGDKADRFRRSMLYPLYSATEVRRIFLIYTYFLFSRISHDPSHKGK